jgi:hypothetical protein
MNEYLNRHFSGHYCQAIINGIQASFDACDELTDYWLTMTIDTANEKDVENIGLLIGFPRPAVPNGLDETSFLFGSEALAPQIDTNTGFGSIYDPLKGGKMSSVFYVSTNLLPLALYREILKIFAIVKYNGLSLSAIDSLVSIAGIPYTFAWDSDADLTVTFETVLPTNYIWLFQTIFDVFCTAPQVLIVNP